MDEKETLKRLLGGTNAVLEAMRYSSTTASGDMANLGNFTSYGMFLRKYNMLAREASPFFPDTTLLDAIDVSKIRSSGDTTWPAQKEMFELAYSNLAILKSLLENAIGFAEDGTHNLRDFLQANLRRAIFARPEREVEIQNAIELLLIGRGMAKGFGYDRETGRVKTSGKESIPDFIFPSLQLCLEVKVANSPDKRKAIIDEINADIRTYGTKYERQLYVVYDLGMIRDEAEFKGHLEEATGVSVLIVKH